MNNYLCIKTLDLDKSVNSVILLSDGNIASCTLYAINIWDAKNDFKFIKTLSLKGYNFFCNLILLANGNIACGAETNNSCYVLIINKSSYKCVKALKSIAHIYHV
jgi:hypothetical protein